MLTLFKHQFKENWRAKMWRNNIAVNIFVALLVLYIAGSFALIGYASDLILKELFPGVPVEYAFSGLLLYYVIGDILVRYIFSNLPVMSAWPYLHLPISKKKVAHHVLFRMLFNVYNFLPLLVLVPFTVKGVLPTYGIQTSMLWGIGIYLIVIGNSYLGGFIKRLSHMNSKWLFVGVLLYATLILLDRFDIISLITISTYTFTFFLDYPWFSLLLILYPLVFYFANYNFLLHHTYLDAVPKDAFKLGDIPALSFLDKLGETGNYMMLEAKMIIRNKRTRGMLLMIPLGVAYGLIFVLNDQYADSYGMFLFTGVFMCGIFMINYGQFILSWEGAYIDGIFSQNIDLKKYYKAKLWLINGVTTLCYLMSLLYGFIDIKFIAINTAMYLYCIGIGSVIMLGFSVYNRRKMELNASAYSWQGVGKSQLLVGLPLFSLPYMIFAPFWAFGAYENGLIAIGACSLLSLSLTNVWIKEIAEKITSTKYEIAETFRES
ncbi:DUF5687 family protein [Limibacter armeniacum]|uniref:DUF5687 family protein n=1 Tax=Limibacter armeniacum TaxID=466084 RepID=UPI002FE51050